MYDFRVTNIMSNKKYPKTPSKDFPKGEPNRSNG